MANRHLACRSLRRRLRLEGVGEPGILVGQLGFQLFQHLPFVFGKGHGFSSVVGVPVKNIPKVRAAKVT